MGRDPKNVLITYFDEMVFTFPYMKEHDFDHFPRQCQIRGVGEGKSRNTVILYKHKNGAI